MAKLFSYVIMFDAGAAPNPFWGYCSLTICKPVIRRTASVGDWILGFGATRVEVKGKGYKSYSGYLVYAMKVSEVLSLREYNEFCLSHLPDKVPVWKTNDWRKRLGDCVYRFSGDDIIQRKSVHGQQHIDTDLSGLNALLSNNFYYFGNKAMPIPNSLGKITHKGRGHKITNDSKQISEFESWIKKFKKNKLYGEPQYRHKYDLDFGSNDSAC